MKYDCYNLDGIKTELKKEISKNETLLKAWEGVTFPTKKDGKPFAVFSKNIEGAKYFKPEYTMQAGENKLSVGGWDDLNGYVNDEIECYTLVEYLKDENMINKTENYMPKSLYLKQVYKFDIEDVKQAVKNRIEYLKNRIESLNEQLLKVDNAYNTFKEMYCDMVNTLKENCNTNDPTFSD